MPKLTLPKQGETIEFFGELDPQAPRVECVITMAPGAVGPPAHIHPRQSETLEVISGHLLATINGEKRKLSTGERTTAELGQTHTFANASPTEPLVFRATIEPALHIQWFISECAKSAIRGGGYWKNLSILEYACIVRTNPDEYKLGGVPFFIQDVLFSCLAALGRLTGKAKNIEPIKTADDSAPR